MTNNNKMMEENMTRVINEFKGELLQVASTFNKKTDDFSHILTRLIEGQAQIKEYIG
jgi:hypothetical protein